MVIIDNDKWLEQLDFRDAERYSLLVKKFNPDYLFHIGAYTDLEFCEKNKEVTFKTNTDSVKTAVTISNKLSIPLLYISTAGIFDGKKNSYDEDDKVKICSVGVCTYVRIETTPWGGIGNVIWNPWDREMEEPPTITVESDTGFGAEFVPRMRYSVQSTTDIVRPLIGIATVIDCPTNDYR